MPAIFNDSGKLAALRAHAAGGNEAAAALMALLDNTYYVALSAGDEAANVIKVTGQVTDQDGSDVAGVKDVLVKAVPIAGAGTMTDGGTGTFKFGSATKEVWLQTDANGNFQVDVLDATAEDCLVIAQLDNGTTEMLKLTFA
jgi:hypothetical protein